MWKSLLFAGTLSIVTAFAGAADAKTTVRVYFGVPFHTYQMGPGYRYYAGYGWYDYRRYPSFANRGNLSCSQARNIVRSAGYHDVRARDCQGRTYVFAGTRAGYRHVIYVNARSGGVWRG